MSDEQVGRLTDRKAWLHYIRPAIEKAERLKAIREGREPDDGPPPIRDLETAEDELAYMRRLGVVGVPDGPEGETP